MTTTTTTSGLHTMLELSTAHLPAHERDLLDIAVSYRPAGLPRIIGHEYGWFIPVPTNAEDGSYRSLLNAHANLVNADKALTYAHQLGAAWVYFDRDADIVDGLPTYDD